MINGSTILMSKRGYSSCFETYLAYLSIMYYPFLLVYLFSLVLYPHVTVLKHPMLVGRKIHVMGCLQWWDGWIIKPRSCNGCTKARGRCWLQRPAASWELGIWIYSEWRNSLKLLFYPGVVKHGNGKSPTKMEAYSGEHRVYCINGKPVPLPCVSAGSL